MNGKKNPLKPSLVLKIFELVLGYICNIPLTYIVLYVFTMLIVLVAGSPIETVFVQILLFALGIKGDSATLAGHDIMQGFIFWWLIIGTVSQILTKAVHVNFSKGTLPLISGIVGIGTAFLIAKTGAIFVPIFLLLLFGINLLMYYALNLGLSKIRVFLNKL